MSNEILGINLEDNMVLEVQIFENIVFKTMRQEEYPNYEEIDAVLTRGQAKQVLEFLQKYLK